MISIRTGCGGRLGQLARDLWHSSSRRKSLSKRRTNVVQAMRIGIWASNPDVDIIIRRCRAARVDTVTLDWTAVPGFVETGIVASDKLRGMVHHLMHCGITVPAMLGNIGAQVAPGEPRSAERPAIERALANIRAMGIVGIPVLINYVHTREPEDPAMDEEAWGRLIEALREYVAVARESKVRLANHGIWKCLDPTLRVSAIARGFNETNYRSFREPGWIGPFLARTAESMNRLIEAVPDACNGVCLCTGMYITGADPAREVLRFRGRIHFVQIRDVSGGRWPYAEEAFPGTGDLNFAEIFGRLAEVGYDGYAHTEHLGRSHNAGTGGERGFEDPELEPRAVAYARELFRAAVNRAGGERLPDHPL